MQATVNARTADLAWVVGTEWQKQGFGSEAAAAMLGWLATQGVEQFSAHIPSAHQASASVATAIGLRPTSETADGEVVWRSTA